MAAQLINPSALAPGLGDVTKEMVRRYRAETKADEVPPHVSMGFNQSWIFFTDVLPRAIKKYGGFDSEALRKAALDTDIPARRHHPGLRREVLPAGPADGRPERTLGRRS